MTLLVLVVVLVLHLHHLGWSRRNGKSEDAQDESVGELHFDSRLREKELMR